RKLPARSGKLTARPINGRASRDGISQTAPRLSLPGDNRSQLSRGHVGCNRTRSYTLGRGASTQDVWLLRHGVARQTRFCDFAAITWQPRQEPHASRNAAVEEGSCPHLCLREKSRECKSLVLWSGL